MFINYIENIIKSATETATLLQFKTVLTLANDTYTAADD
jgi:hypothetical protein